ncbi:hypothetical protein PsorP6_018923 [Peronosclerospora sorghi]|nr:hypothetical protein PsorP6_018923 [Peronosclerospora sorghi]
MFHIVCVDFGVIVEPKAILTHVEQALIDAVDALFTEIKHMLCISHIQMNILYNHKKELSNYNRGV